MHGREGLHPGQRALELADVALDLMGDEAEHLFGDEAPVVELGVEDGEPRLEVRGLDVSDESPLEPRTQPILERGDLLGGTVGRDHDLLVDLVQRIEGVEELFLRSVLAGEELHVVDQQDVDGAVLVPELAHARGGDRADDLVRELLRREIDDPLARETVVDLVPDRVHQVGLAQAHTSIQEERVVAVARSLGHRLRRRVGELRVVTDDE